MDDWKGACCRCRTLHGAAIVKALDVRALLKVDADEPPPRHAAYEDGLGSTMIGATAPIMNNEPRADRAAKHHGRSASSRVSFVKVEWIRTDLVRPPKAIRIEVPMWRDPRSWARVVGCTARRHQGTPAGPRHAAHAIRASRDTSRSPTSGAGSVPEESALGVRRRGDRLIAFGRSFNAASQSRVSSRTRPVQVRHERWFLLRQVRVVHIGG